MHAFDRNYSQNILKKDICKCYWFRLGILSRFSACIHSRTRTRGVAIFYQQVHVLFLTDMWEVGLEDCWAFPHLIYLKLISKTNMTRRIHWTRKLEGRMPASKSHSAKFYTLRVPSQKSWNLLEQTCDAHCLEIWTKLVSLSSALI